VYDAKGDLPAAAEHLRRALAIDQEALGPEHPHLATHRGNLGRNLARQGQIDEGLAELEAALATYERAGDRGSAAAVLAMLGQIEYGRGRIDRAVAHLTRATQELEAALGPEHPTDPMLGTMLGNLGTLRLEQGDVDAAIELQRRALAIAEAVHGRDGRGVVSAAGNLGIGLRTRGDVDEALRLHQRVLEILERERGPNHVDVASAAYDLAETLEANGRRGPAREAMERAAEIYAQASEPEATEALTAAREWLASHPGASGPP
jgi:tetratricopeptide (TPR) repeat protein